MQEWINQAEEDYLERDFTYKTPEELRKAVEELKVCKADVLGRVCVRVPDRLMNTFLR